jgi:hypothetical protein
LRTWQRYWIRGMLAIIIGGIVAGLTAISPALWDTSLLAGWDAGIITWLVLAFIVIRRADAQCTWEQAQALEPETLRVLFVVIITSVVGLLGAVALSTRMAGRGQFAQVVHFGAGAIAVALAWFFVHTEFGCTMPGYITTRVHLAGPQPPVLLGRRLPFAKGWSFQRENWLIIGPLCITLLPLPCAIRHRTLPSRGRGCGV